MLTLFATKDGFEVTFTEPVDAVAAADVANYSMAAWTYIYQSGYGSPEVDQTTPRVTKAVVSPDGLSVMLSLDKITEDHIHDFDLAKITSPDGQHLLHNKAYYTVNEIPKK